MINKNSLGKSVKLVSNKLNSLVKLRFLLIIGSIIHIISTFGVFVIGRSGKVPQMFNESGAMWKDAIDYFARFTDLSSNISGGDFSYFFTNTEQIHVRLYSISHFLFAPITGNNILALEPFNLAIYLLNLTVIFKIGQILFDLKTGFSAALVIGLFPTFLLHSTQPLRDPLFILIFFVILLILISILKETLTLKRFTAALIICYLLFIVMWLIREGAYPIYAVEVISMFCLFILKYRQTLKQRFKEIMIFGCFLSLVLTIPFIYKNFQPNNIEVAPKTIEMIKNSRKVLKAKLENQYFSKTLLIINMTRLKFIGPEMEPGSTIDGDVTFLNIGDVLMFVPRAVLIGTLAPFPNTWFEQGKSFGKIGRLISAAETFVFYILMICAAFTIYAYRKSIEVWFLVFLAFCGTSSLGFFVGNVGTLYRLRYVFWFMLIIIGCRGVFIIMDLISKKYFKEQKINT